MYCLTGLGELAEQLTAADVPVQSLHVTSRWDWTVVGRLKRALDEFKPELLQTFLFHANIVGRFAGWRARVPVTVCGVRVVEQDARRRMRLDRMTNRLVAHTVCVSQAVAATYRSLGYAGDQLSVIRNGVEYERFASAPPADLKEFGIPANARTLLAVGRLHSQKGLDILLEAIPPVLNEHSDVHLLIAGEGPQRRELEATIAASPHRSRIHLIGRRSDVPSLMQACDVFVLSSRWEGMPNVVLEAMAAGLPVVAADVEGVRDLVVHGETGRIVESASALSLTVNLNWILSESDSARMGLAGQERVRTHFQWEQVVAEYDRLYQRLLATIDRPD